MGTRVVSSFSLFLRSVHRSLYWDLESQSHIHIIFRIFFVFFVFFVFRLLSQGVQSGPTEVSHRENISSFTVAPQLAAVKGNFHLPFGSLG